MKAGLPSRSEAAILKWISDVTDMLCNLPAPAVTCETSEALANLRDELNKSIQVTKRPQTKMKRKLSTFAILVGLTFSAFAPPDPTPDMAAPKLRSVSEVEPPTPAPALFGSKEFTLDLSGTYATDEPEGLNHVLETSKRHGDFGASLGATKFFTRKFGISAEVGVNDLNNIEDVDYAAVSIIARWPLDVMLAEIPVLNRSAPYVVAGTGRSFHTGDQFGVAGIGCEIRITPRIGMFGDSRFIFTDEKSDGLLVSRIGVRVVF